ncbi:MAG TPA: DUF6516 family protein [Albitalea sp.]|nr:DUF6516 family protein [Albitalea sp.]
MLHLEIKDALEREFPTALAEPPRLTQDALRVTLNNGVVLELRVPAEQAYSFAWRWGDAELRIDTAPLHPGLASFPNHLHDANGEVRADTLTSPAAGACDNVRAVIQAVLRDPLLGAGAAV